MEQPDKFMSDEYLIYCFAFPLIFSCIIRGENVPLRPRPDPDVPIFSNKKDGRSVEMLMLGQMWN